MRIEVILGLILILDGIISIYFSSSSRVSYNVFNLSSQNILYIGHLFRIIRILIGLLLVLAFFRIENYFLFLGVYLILDASSSILTASSFKSWDDYFRVIRMIIGIYFIGLKIR